MMIWDLHCHLGAVDGATPHARMAELMRMADRVGVERVVIFTGEILTLVPEPSTWLLAGVGSGTLFLRGISAQAAPALKASSSFPPIQRAKWNHSRADLAGFDRPIL